MVSMLRVPSPLPVLTKPLVERLLSLERFCVLLTVTVLVLRVRPVLKVSGTS